jgi:hypothetical protein
MPILRKGNRFSLRPLLSRFLRMPKLCGSPPLPTRSDFLELFDQICARARAPFFALARVVFAVVRDRLHSSWCPAFVGVLAVLWLSAAIVVVALFFYARSLVKSLEPSGVRVRPRWGARLNYESIRRLWRLRMPPILLSRARARDRSFSTDVGARRS